ncbi:hypothetical protein LMG29542_07225 [Paraburkholderia humisilvae]|uniref:Uncharacterized protein n=1 Tax=Paraburkholderia humisilvae TaxID=627669 RepID=A0A6J5F819_9BURK|nr:hypothetical protein LMG29542_07225 [Paraburkholderia humisilvae]
MLYSTVMQSMRTGVTAFEPALRAASLSRAARFGWKNFMDAVA